MRGGTTCPQERTSRRLYVAGRVGGVTDITKRSTVVLISVGGVKEARTGRPKRPGRAVRQCGKAFTKPEWQLNTLLF